jgi:hypothetical protein
MTEKTELPGKKPKNAIDSRRARRRYLRDQKAGKLPGKKPGRTKPKPPPPAEKE